MPRRRRPGGGRAARRTGPGVALTQRPAPRDLLHRYLTPAEAFGAFPGAEEPLAWLRAADQESVLREVAVWLGKFDESGLNGWKQIERDWVSETIREPHRSRILGLLHGDRTLVSTQSLMIAAKRALTVGRPTTNTNTVPLFMAAVSIQGGLGTHRDPNESTDARRLRLQAELISNALFHRRPQRGMRVAQSQIRWRDIPGRGDVTLPIAPAHAFEQVTGIPLIDLQAVGFSLFAQAMAQPGGTPTVAAIADVFHWERGRFERVLGLISATIEDIAALIRRDERTYGEDWSFDALRRFPVLRLSDDRVLVLSPHLILERTLGWLPVFDLTQPAGASDEVRAIARLAKTAFEAVCEREVVETLEANVAGGRNRGHLFDGATLRATYPTGRIADAAIAYGDE
jgi:hypothetical protein